MMEEIRALLRADPFELALMGAGMVMAAATIVLSLAALILREEEQDEFLLLAGPRDLLCAGRSRCRSDGVFRRPRNRGERKGEKERMNRED